MRQISRLLDFHLPGVSQGRFRLIFGLLLILLTGCSGVNDPYPTLIPTLVVGIPTATETMIPATETVIPTRTAKPITATSIPQTPTVRILGSATPIKRLTPTPIGTAVLPPTRINGTATLPPVRATLANGAASITITAAQLNHALKEAWRQGMALDYPPVVTFKDGLLLTEMRIKMKLVTLQLTLGMVSTTKGNVLDLRAVGVSTIDGVTTTQIKQGQALVQTMIEWLIYQAAAGQQLTYGGVAVSGDTITITLLTD